MIHQYESKYEQHIIELPDKRTARFEGHLFVTDDDNLASQIEATSGVKRGEIKKVIGEIKKASRKFVSVKGGGATSGEKP